MISCLVVHPSWHVGCNERKANHEAALDCLKSRHIKCVTGAEVSSSLGIDGVIDMRQRSATLLAPLDVVETEERALTGEAAASLGRLQHALTQHLPAGALSVYEAGGGSTSYLPPTVHGRARISVVDIDPVQLRNNDYADEKICGDIQTHRFAAGSFDLVACYNVIEHLPNVESALDNFVTSLRPGGLLLIGAPNPRSLSGVVTKYTPHWFHVWYYRRVLGRKNAGQPGEPPFPTYFHPLVTLPRLRNYLQRHGFDVVYEKAYESPRYPEMRVSAPLLSRVVDFGTAALNLMLFRRVNLRHGDYHLLARKA